MSSSRILFSQIYWPLVVTVVLITALGVYNLHSAAAAKDPNLYITQLLFFGTCCLLTAGILFFDYRISENIAYPVYAIACILLLAVLIQGKTMGGAQRWISLGPATFQPSEPAKLALILCLARYFSYRVQSHGYTLRSLFRLLNPSRPCAFILILILSWHNPWLLDPLGQLARLVRNKLGSSVVQINDLLWFKAFVMVVIAALFISGLILFIRLEKKYALLDPWPPGRLKRIIFLWLALFLTSIALVISYWGLPFFCDPFGVIMAYLYKAAASGAKYEKLNAGMGFRVLLVFSASLYAISSLYALKHRKDSIIDLSIAPIDLVALPALLILIEPDLGTAGITILIGLTMIFIVGVRFRSLVILGVMGACVSVIGWFGILKDYQKRRILTFIDPEQDIKGAGWNAVQSMIAVGSGRWSGKGHLEGTQSQLYFLPEQHTDFAFSVWAEEQGFVGSVILVILVALLIIFSLSIAAHARDTYGTLLATGITALLFWQALINIGMVIGLFPVVGMPMPLFSYGGSSLVTVMLGIGLLLNIHARKRGHV